MLGVVFLQRKTSNYIYPIERLEIIYETDELVAINKPHGLLVHRTSLAKDATVFALQLLRDQLGKRVYPVHRLDRKTSGVLLFAKSPETHSQVQKLFQTRQVHKVYLAIVRGFLEEKGEISYPLIENGKVQEAYTSYRMLNTYEIPFPSGKFVTSRYSLVELYPETGRYHQLRKHLAHIFHPIIGDRPHGCNKQNRFWKERFNMTVMLLHASELNIELPNQSKVIIHAGISSEFQQALEILDNHQMKNTVDS